VAITLLTSIIITTIILAQVIKLIQSQFTTYQLMQEILVYEKLKQIILDLAWLIKS